jgi:DNA-binding transcriptional regulator YiaG
MNSADKSGVILKFWTQIEESRFFNEEDCLAQDERESFDNYYLRILEQIILKYFDTKPAKELFKRLKLDGIFKVVEDTTNPNGVEIVYQNEYLPYRLDLFEFSPYGFSLGNGTSSAKQLALAILATASNDKTAKKYYMDFVSFVLEILNNPKNILGKKEISYIQVQQWLINKKREDMKNIVKYVCSELDITQKALAEEIGVSEGTVNRWSAKPDEVPLQTQKTLKILLENAQLKENQEKLQKAISLLEEVKNSQNISVL